LIQKFKDLGFKVSSISLVPNYGSQNDSFADGRFHGLDSGQHGHNGPKPVSRVAGCSLRSCGVVNLAARGMLVVSVARRLGSEGPLPTYCAARSNRAGPEKGALSPLS